MKKLYLIILSIVLIYFAHAGHCANPQGVVNSITKACKYLSSGEYDKSIAASNEAIAMDPKCSAAYYSRGYAYRYKGEYKKAIDDFNRALDINPKYAEAYVGRAKVYYEKGEYEKAWQDVRQAEAMGAKIEPEFLANLKNASGKSK